MTTDVLDINVWIALSFPDHVHHDRATSYWDNESGSQLAFCRVTMLGFLRLSTNERLVGPAAVSVAQAWEGYDKLLAIPEVELITEAEGCETVLAKWVESGAVTTQLWTDAYLAALALTVGGRLVSFDGGFARFGGLDFLHLRRIDAPFS